MSMNRPIENGCHAADVVSSLLEGGGACVEEVWMCAMLLMWCGVEEMRGTYHHVCVVERVPGYCECCACGRCWRVGHDMGKVLSGQMSPCSW